jgi:hypothetical protein
MNKLIKEKVMLNEKEIKIVKEWFERTMGKHHKEIKWELESKLNTAIGYDRNKEIINVNGVLMSSIEMRKFYFLKRMEQNNIDLIKACEYWNIEHKVRKTPHIKIWD